MLKKKIEKYLDHIFRYNLKKLDIKKNDNLYLAINLGGIFKSLNKSNDLIVEAFKNKEYYSKYIINILEKKILPGGSLICPAFSFSFIKKKIFDLQKTRTDLGVFSQVFLNDNRSVRTDHPIHSLSIIGNLKRIIGKKHGKYSFGANSPFGKFLENKIKFLNVGVNFGDTCTYVHHLEHISGCNYRFYKTFKGKVKKKNFYLNETFYDFVRYFQVGDEKLKNEYLMENILRKKKLIKYSKKKAFFSVTKVSDVHEQGLKLLMENSNVFLKGKRNIILDDKSHLKKNYIKVKVINEKK